MPPPTPPDSLDLPSPPEFIFKPSDVRLKITFNGSPAYAHVSSHAMSLASPVFKNFLFPPWSTDIDEPVKELDFTEDNTEALIVLLCVVHLKSEFIPKGQPTRELMVELAILCDRYLCAGLLKPWMEKWMSKEFEERFKSRELTAERLTQAEKCQVMLFLGFIFDIETFERAVKWLFYCCTEVQLKLFPGIPDNWSLPNGIIHKIVAARARAVSICCTHAKEFHDALKSREQDTSLCPQHCISYQECSTFNLKACYNRLRSLDIFLPLQGGSEMALRHSRGCYLPTCIWETCITIDSDSHPQADDLVNDEWLELLRSVSPGPPLGRSKLEAMESLGRVEKVTGKWKVEKHNDNWGWSGDE